MNSNAKINLSQKSSEDTPLFSVIVLTYMQRHLLNDCLDSIFKQDYPNIELVICDDCSADFEADEVRVYIEENGGENIRNVVIYQQPHNVGTVQNAQTGIELSSGVFFKLQAGDDMLYGEGSLSKMGEALSRPGVNIVAARSVACLYTGELTSDCYPASNCVASMINADAETQFDLIGSQPWGAYINAPAVVWRRSFFDKIGGFDRSYKYTEDWTMWLKITHLGYRITVMDEIIVIYRYGGISSSSSDMHSMVGELFYQECVRMFHDLVIPKYEATHNRKKLFRCQHCIHCIENRSIWEFKWEKWGFLKRLTWRINNISFILTSWMYRTYYGSFPVFHGREPLQIMAYSLFLFYFRAEIITGQSSNRLWAAIFFCAALWFLLKLIYVCGIKLAIFILKFARNLKRGQNND